MCGWRVDGHGYNELAKAGRFLSNAGEIEWFEFGFKVKSVYVDSPNVSLSGNGFSFPVGSECTVWVEVDCIGKENLLSLDSLAVTFGNSNVVYRTVQDERMQGATIYYVYCTCNEEGSFDLTVSVGGASYTTKVVAYNK
jgi:hypothetical protein